MSIPDNSYKERVNFTGVMEKANYRKSLEGLSRKWNLAGIVSFLLAAASSLTQGALLSLGLCTLVTSGTIFTPIQIALPMAIYLLRDCFKASRLKVVDFSTASYAFLIFVHSIWFQIIRRITGRQLLPSRLVRMAACTASYAPMIPMVTLRQRPLLAIGAVGLCRLIPRIGISSVSRENGGWAGLL